MDDPARSSLSIGVTVAALLAAALAGTIALRACTRVVEPTAASRGAAAVTSKTTPADEVARADGDAGDDADDGDGQDADGGTVRARPTAPDRARSKAEREARRAERRRGRDPRDHSTPGERRAGQMFESPPDARYPTGTPARIPVDGQFSDSGGTVSLWLDPAWGGASQDDATIVKIGDGTLRLVKNVTFLRFEAMDPNGRVDGVGVPIADWQPGQWRFLSVVWDSGTLSLYVDGQLATSKFIGFSPTLPEDTAVIVGSQFPVGRPAAGTIAGVEVNRRPLSPYAVGHVFDRATPPGTGQ